MENQNKPEQRVIINANREGYTPVQVRGTMTVGELKKLLEEYEEDSPVILSFDNGYTYGGISRLNVNEEYIPADEDEDDE